ncbi:MAG: CD225/dispanin family protein [Gemmataceae bacterium]
MARSRDDDYEDDDYDDRPARRRRDDDDYDDAPRGTPPPNYMVQSILVTLCCCLIGGIIAIINASQVNSKWAAGDYAGAKKASEQAKMWCLISVGVGLVVNLISVAVQVMAMQAGGGR